tara:strand:+ start:1473 stop:2459 length:987 start_codon:yes stop_codon:yes gene_type:complete
METSKGWCRHTEARRNKIEKSIIAKRYTKKIEKLINKNKINLENSLKNWENYNIYSKNQYLPEPEIKLKQFSKLTKNDLKKYLKLIKKETNNFTKIEPEIFIRIPQSITLFRIALCLSYVKLKKLKVISGRGLRSYDNLKSKIKPTTAKKLSNFFNKEFKNKSITYNKFLENYRILKGFYGCRNLNFLIEQGLNRLAKINPTKYKEEISKFLKKQNIKFERYKVLKGIKSKYNIDFYIPHKEIAIEVFSYNNCKKRSDIKWKACFVDHRFQSLKLKNPKTKTIMCIKIEGKSILHDYVKEYIDMELINTDYLLINKELNKLPRIINVI